MANIHFICLYASLLASVCNHKILHVEARPMKSSYHLTTVRGHMVSRRALTDYITDTTPGHSPGVGHKQLMDDKVNDAPQFHKNPTNVHFMAGDMGDTSYGHILGVGYKDSETYKKNVHTLAMSHSITSHIDDTSPGHSPGVGHEHFMEYEKKVHSPSSRYSITYDVADTSPGHSPGVGHKHLDHKKTIHDSATQNSDITNTTPGHSPGVGHKHSTEHYKKDAQPEAHGHNAAFAGDSVADDINDTSPGHSPGVGHKHIVGYKEYKVDVDHSLNNPFVKISDVDNRNDTSPGHSPGVGHKHLNKFVMQQVAQGRNDKKNPNDARPGRSPNVGHKHILDKKNEGS